jgi:hypothetical protein
LLSTSGGILFATVSGECTRNAKSVVAVHDGLARLPGLDATGSGDEGSISNNNGLKANEQKTKVSTVNWHGTSREIVGNGWWQGMNNNAFVCRARCAGLSGEYITVAL